MFASVIVPTHNRRKWILRAVEALLRQDYPPDAYEVIVSCDHCADGTQEALQGRFGSRIRIITSAVPGLAPTLNAALAQACGDLAVFMDDEMEPVPGFVSAHVQAHQSRGCEKIGIIGYSPVVIGPDSTPIQHELARNYEQFFSDLSRPSRKSTLLDLNIGNCSLPLKPLLEARFDESYVFARIDWELAARLLELGFNFYFCEEARADMHIAVTADVLIRRTTERARNDYRLARKYPWCVPHLPFYSVPHKRSRRWRWRVLWKTGNLVADAISIVRGRYPENLRLVRWEYTARYCFSLGREIGDWDTLRRLCNSNRT